MRTDTIGGGSVPARLRPIPRWLVVTGGVVLLAAAVTGSVLIGAGGLPPDVVLERLLHDDRSPDAVVVWNMRVTRTATALVAGAALGVAGHLMQAIVRNPLADPGLLGVNAGAGFAVVLATGTLGVSGFAGTVGFALAGAIVVSAVVYVIGFTTARDAPATLVLAGTALSSVLFGIATGLALIDPSRFNALRGWLAGSVAGRSLAETGAAAVLIGLGVLVVLFAHRPIAQLALGDDVARALGTRVTATRVLAAVAVMLLAGTATAIGGPIVFIGLLVPHLARAVVGLSSAWTIAVCAIAGSTLLVFSDTLGRIVLPSGEVPAGVVTAILGAPVLALLARGRRGTT